MTTLYIIAVHAAGTALAVWGVVRSGDRPQVLVYAFVLEYGLRLLTVFVVTLGLAAGRDNIIIWLAPAVCRLPAADERSSPLVHDGSVRGAGFGTYVLVVAVLSFFAFVLSNVNAEQELDLDWPMFTHDLQWGMLVALVYWLESILTRSLVVDPQAPAATNFGYNTRELTVLSFTVLIAGAVVVIRQASGRPASGWVLLGPLFAFRFLYDAWAALRRSQPQ